MKKRIAALLLCCAMLLTLSPSLIATAAAEDKNTVVEQTDPTGDKKNESAPASDTGDAANNGDAAKNEETPEQPTVPEQPATPEEPAAPEEPTTPEQSTEDEGKIPQTVVFTDAGPFSPAVNVAAARSMLRAAAKDTEDDGLKLNKTAKANDDGTYTITLESYTTGSVTTDTKTKPVDIVLVLDQSTSMSYTFGDDAIYDYQGNNSSSRQYAMKQAVYSFINNVKTQYSDDSDHRIAIVKFGNAYEDVRGWTFVNEEGANNLRSAVSQMKISSDTGTQAQTGMNRANRLINTNYTYSGKNTDRQKVVILFTDGIPGNYDFNPTVANQAVAYAKEIKSKGATVYTIGIFNGANVNEMYGTNSAFHHTSDGSINSHWCNTSSGTYFENGNSYATRSKTVSAAAGNRFLNLVSSNFKDASACGLDFYKDAEYSAYYGWKITRNFNRTASNYYLTANNASSLDNIFQEISSNISTPTIDLGSQTVVKDIISDYFEIPADAKKINVYTAEATANALDNPDTANSWKSRVVDTAINPVISADGKTVSVSGFDYTANFVAKTGRGDNGDFYGKKLIVEFTVRPKAGFLGGNGVPTNGADSGVYNDGNLIKNFEVPAVDVAVPAVTVTALDKNVYLMQMPGAADLKTDAAATCNGVNLLDKGAYTGSNAWKADFVNVSVEAKTSVGFDATADGTYTVTAKVSPKTNGTATVQKAEVTKAIKVFLPEQTFCDSQITLGNVADYADNTGALVWIHDTTLSTAVAMIGDAPELVYTFDPAAKAFAQDTEVRVTDVKIGGKNAAQYVTFYRDACAICQAISGVVEGDAANFVVHVKSLSLTIVKNFSGGAPMDPNQSAVFTVSGPMGTLDVILNNANGFRVTINGLKSGKYTVVEKNDWTWRYTPDKLRVSVPLTGDETVMPTVTFTNELSNSYWLSGGAYCDNRWSISNTPAIN